jgi:hypothetical protein
MLIYAGYIIDYAGSWAGAGSWLREDLALLHYDLGLRTSIDGWSTKERTLPRPHTFWNISEYRIHLEYTYGENFR